MTGTTICISLSLQIRFELSYNTVAPSSWHSTSAPSHGNRINDLYGMLSLEFALSGKLAPAKETVQVEVGIPTRKLPIPDARRCLRWICLQLMLLETTRRPFGAIPPLLNTTPAAPKKLPPPISIKSAYLTFRLQIEYSFHPTIPRVAQQDLLHT